MDRKQRRNDGLEHCPDCGGLMTNTMDPKRIMCSDCGAIIELARTKKRGRA